MPTPSTFNSPQPRIDQLHILGSHRLCEFNNQHRRMHIGLRQRATDALYEIGLVKIQSRKIDCYRNRKFAPSRNLRQGLVEHPAVMPPTKPSLSAIGMNSLGGTSPSSGSSQRTKASAPAMPWSASRIFGCRAKESWLLLTTSRRRDSISNSRRDERSRSSVNSLMPPFQIDSLDHTPIVQSAATAQTYQHFGKFRRWRSEGSASDPEQMAP